MNPSEYSRLHAHSAHDIDAMNPEPPETVWRGRGTMFHDLESGAKLAERNNVSVYINPHKDTLIIRGHDAEDTEIKPHQLETLIALLQRAQTIIQGGV